MKKIFPFVFLILAVTFLFAQSQPPTKVETAKLAAEKKIETAKINAAEKLESARAEAIKKT
ncbi:MAG: hypothetical protein Q8L04_03290, partial [Ignavibacteria bacterium]|nr:hypothetical protein [Ignavibacteria bacterium]